MKRTEAVLFDVDGTLLDTGEFIYRSFDHAFRSQDIVPARRKDVAKVMGKPLKECYALLSPSSDADALCRAHRAFQLENLGLSGPFPETSDVLGELRAAGIRIAAVTTRSRASSVSTLESAGIRDRLNVIVCGDDTRELKPHPEPLFLALRLLGVGPEKAVMVGDTAADILAGKNAGTGTIGVTYGFHGERIRENAPDHTVDNLRDILPIIIGAEKRGGR